MKFDAGEAETYQYGKDGFDITAAASTATTATTAWY